MLQIKLVLNYAAIKQRKARVSGKP